MNLKLIKNHRGSLGLGQTNKPLIFTATNHIFIAALMLLMFSGQVYAAEDNDGWNITLTPYLWGVAMDGKTGIGTLPPVDVDASFSDILDSLNFAASLHTEFRKGKWNFVIDPTYMDLELDLGSMDMTVPNPDYPPDPQTFNVNVSGKVKIKMWFVEAWTSYLFLPEWEVLGGIRYQDQEITPQITIAPPDITLSPKIDEDWTDFFAGVRWSKTLSNKWFMVLRGDYAFAGDSESGSWNGVVFFNRRFGETMALNLGYRYFTNEYDTDAYLWDMDMTGPVVGYTWQFGNTRWPR